MLKLEEIKNVQAMTRLLSLFFGILKWAHGFLVAMALFSRPLIFSIFKTKISELRVVFWECSLREIMWLLFAAYLFVLSRIIVIFLILECSWRSCVLSLLNCAKYVLECSFPGYSTLISVTPSYVRLQWTFLLGVQLWFYSGTFSSWFRLSCMISRGQEWFFFFPF